VCQRHGQIHVIAATQTDFRFFCDNALIQSGKGNRKLDSRAGLSATGERQFLIDHRQNAAAGGFNRHDCSVHSTQSVDGCFAHNGVFAGSHIAFGNILSEGTGIEAFVITMPAAHACGGCRDDRAAVSQVAHAPSGVLTLADFL